MRLSEKEKEVIVTEAQASFGVGTKVILFGSRVNDSGKGGDIDLMIVPVQDNTPDVLYSKKIKYAVALDMQLGEQKIDIVIKYPNDNRGIIQTAFETGIALC